MKQKLSFLLALLLVLSLLCSCVAKPDNPVDSNAQPSDGTPTDSNAQSSDGTEIPEQPTVLEIGSDRQVFWDNYFVDTKNTDAVLTLKHPVQREIVYTADAPWEGNSCDYYSLIQIPRDDGSTFYRMYYNAWDSENFTGTADIRICAIESEDGIHWTRPDYGLHSFDGNEHTNIVMQTEAGFDNFFVFIDTNPNCPADQKFKAVSEYLEADDYGALHGYTSPDGLNWTECGLLMSRAWGTFDSLNTCFYNPQDGEYYLYFRGFHGYDKDGNIRYYGDPKRDTVRDIRVSHSADFDLLFCSPVDILDFTDPYDFALYTNNIQPYYRAPQIYVGFPTRYNDHSVTWTENMEYMPDRDERYTRFQENPRYATTATDALFITSRDGKTFDRFTSAWATAGAEHTGNWIYGDCYFAYGMIETPTEFEDQANEISMYAFEGKFKSGDSRLYRYTSRIDGFACYQAPSYDVSTLTTKPFTFTGSTMKLNFATDGAGSIVVEVLDKDGKVLEGYTSYTIFGDQVDREITFGEDCKDLSALVGQTVSLRFTMRSAEVYSLVIE